MDKDEMRKDLERQEKDVLEQIKRLEGHDAQPFITSDGGDLPDDGAIPRPGSRHARDDPEGAWRTVLTVEFPAASTHGR